ncbi:Thioredoxin-like fold protein [Pleurostoma richardsiae]|uniref:Protein disulfide-isomerase n=1 Tax=Pleurostoma richardsiae TaxID=41990 RepID=A0AA38RWV9_9PEZI|nr:Thioredoxin-like fold protein [Pleurostoma richardsiae]
MALVTSLWLLLGQTLAWEYTTESAFKTALKTNNHTLVAYVLPSQSATQALESEWDSIQTPRQNMGLISVDCQSTPEVCSVSDVASFPAIRLHHQSGNFDRYRGPRNAGAISSYLRRTLLPTVSEVDDRNQITFASSDDVVIVANLAPDDSSLEERFREMAAQYHDRYSFAIGPRADRESALTCFNNADSEQHAVSQLTAVDALEKFLKQCARPVIPELTRRNEMEYLSMGKSLVHFVVSNEAEKQKYVDAMRPLAKKYSEYLVFTTIDANEYPEMLAPLGLPRGSSKGLSVQNPSSGDVFPYTSKTAISVEVVESFLMNIIRGNIKPWVADAGNTDFLHHEEL